MYLPFDFNSISFSLLVISVVLLITAQLIQSDDFPTIYVIKGRLCNVALITGALFLGTIIIRVFLMVLAGVEYPPNI
jgi:hypothetical protein